MPAPRPVSRYAAPKRRRARAVPATSAVISTSPPSSRPMESPSPLIALLAMASRPDGRSAARVGGAGGGGAGGGGRLEGPPTAAAPPRLAVEPAAVAGAP